MIEVRQTRTFAEWLGRLRDRKAKVVIELRLDRIAAGNLGDWKPVGDGVGELRIPYGPGYRAYFVREGDVLILLLCGGDKSTQARDIGAPKCWQSNGGLNAPRNDALRHR